MSLFTMDNGNCRNCKHNGKCESQKRLLKAISDTCTDINNNVEDDAVVGTVVLVCNRGGE